MFLRDVTYIETIQVFMNTYRVGLLTSKMIFWLYQAITAQCYKYVHLQFLLLKPDITTYLPRTIAVVKVVKLADWKQQQRSSPALKSRLQQPEPRVGRTVLH